MKWRVVEEKIFLGISVFSALVVVGILFGIIGVIFIEAIPSLSLEFIITPENKMPGVGGAIGNAIVGTIAISTVATILAIPLGICTAIYLSRYAKDSPFTRGFRFLIEVLSGTPSIVVGMFGLLILVFYLRQYTGGFSLISGSIALAILIMPVIERAAEDAIHTVDTHLEHGSYALGARKWDTIKNITLPYARSGIITGIILAFGRAAEESAVVILTAGYSQFMPEFAVKSHDKLAFGMKVYPIQDLVGTLPYSVYHAFENSHIVSLSDGFAAAFVLIIIILIVNSTAKIILWYSYRTPKKPSPFISSLKRQLFDTDINFHFPVRKNRNPIQSSDLGTILDEETCEYPPTRHAAPAQPVRPASPYTSIESGENPHPLPAAKGRPGMHPEGRLYPDGTTQCYPATDPISGLPREQRVAPASCTALSDLFEDGPPGGPVDGEYGGSAGPGGDTLLSEDLPLDLLCRHFLMEEAEEIPFRENWRNMTRNREENTHV